MKLATYKNHTRDGWLMLVSNDLTRVKPAAAAATLQSALDNWTEVASRLQEEYAAVNRGGGEAFDSMRCESPLPRAYQWADGSAYLNHVELVRRARGAEMPASFHTDPLMYQGGSDSFIGPRDDIVALDEAHGIDLEAEVAVITDDVPMAVGAGEAAKHMKLLMLVNDVSLRGLIPAELGKGFGFFHSKPSSSFSPVAVTPDELGDAFADGKVNLPMQIDLNGEAFGRVHAGRDMNFSLPQLIKHAAKTRPLCAGTIVGSGTISNRGEDGAPSKPAGEGGAGYACIAEARMVEAILHGDARMPFLRFGDCIRIEMRDADGRSIFGAIEQRVVQFGGDGGDNGEG